MAALNADRLEALHGPLLRSAACRDLKMRALFEFLTEETKPPINITEGQVGYWIQNYRLPPGAVAIGSVDELGAKYGDEMRVRRNAPASICFCLCLFCSA